MTAMDLTAHTSVLPDDDPEASLPFNRDILGFEVRTAPSAIRRAT